MSTSNSGDATQSVAVDTVAKLLRKLSGQHDIGQVYEYTYQNKVVMTVDSTKSGRLSIKVAPSAWASQIAEHIWQYELEGDDLTEPTMADPTVNGWEAVMLTDAPEDDSATIDEEAERNSDSEAEAEALREADSEDNE